MGDIALPNVRYEREWNLQKANKTYLEEIEKYQKEVLHEGLQVEEEGLPGLQAKKQTGSGVNGTLGILKVGQERARNRIKPKPKNKTLTENTRIEDNTEATPITLTTTPKPLTLTSPTRKSGKKVDKPEGTKVPTIDNNSTKPLEKKKNEDKHNRKNRRPHRQRKNKDHRRRRNRRKKKQKHE